MKISGRKVQKAVVSGGARLPVVSEQASSRSALTTSKLCTDHRCKNAMDLLGLSFVSLSKKICRRSPVCWYTTDSCASRSKSRRMAELAQREVVHFLSLKSIAREFRLQPTGVAKSTSFVNWVCLIHRVLVYFP